MARLVEEYQNKTIKNGELLKVYNTDRKKFSNAKKIYNAIWLNNINEYLSEEICLLFTDNDIKRIITTSLDNILNIGDLYKVNDNNHIYYIFKCTNNLIYKISKSTFERALKRTSKNLEDIPKKKWYIDLFD